MALCRKCKACPAIVDSDMCPECISDTLRAARVSVAEARRDVERRKGNLPPKDAPS